MHDVWLGTPPARLHLNVQVPRVPVVEAAAMTVAICTPTRGRPSMHWVSNLTSMLPPPGGHRLLTERNLPVDLSRNKLAERALDLPDIDRVFYLDDDVLVPRDGLQRLVAMQDRLLAEGEGLGGIVSGVYYCRAKSSDGPVLNAYADVGTPEEPAYRYLSNKALEQDSDVLMVDGVGAGCLLVHRSILERLQKPWFQFNCWSDRKPGIGEDLWLCWRARTLLNVHVALVPTVRCGHLTEAMFDAEGLLRIPEEGGFASNYEPLDKPDKASL